VFSASGPRLLIVFDWAGILVGEPVSRKKALEGVQGQWHCLAAYEQNLRAKRPTLMLDDKKLRHRIEQPHFHDPNYYLPRGLRYSSTIGKVTDVDSAE
jgi:hypothetical protein